MISNDIRLHLNRVCKAFNQHGVETMLIGGAAVGYYGYQRISGAGYHSPAEMKHDLDFWYKPTNQNFINLVNAIKELGQDSKELDKIVFDPKKTYLRIPFKDFKVELLPQMKGLESFDTTFKNARPVELDGNKINIIGYQDLVKNKQAVNREIDQKDIQVLKKKNRDKGIGF